MKELKKMFKQAIKLRNNNYDGFAELFCTLFGYKTIEVIPLEGTIKDIMNSKFILDIDTDTVFTLED